MYSFHSRILFLKQQKKLQFIATHIRVISILILLTSITLLVLYKAQADALYQGGTGTREDPYQIANCEQLQNMKENLSSFYILTNDIDCQSIVEGVGWEPVGTWPTTAGFRGSLDGAGYMITNFGINKAGGNLVGLFGYVAGGTVKNLHLRKGVINGTIVGGTRTGALVGDVWGMKIENVSSDISVISTSTSAYARIGGLVGSGGQLYIDKSYAEADITASSGGRVGGLVGVLGGESMIFNSYSSGSVTADSIVGGLVGETSSNIKNSYSSSDVTLLGGGAVAGGVVGAFYHEGTNGVVSIENSFSTGSLTGNVSALVGTYTSSNSFANITNSYFDQTTTGKTSCVGSPSLTSATSTCLAVNTDGSTPTYFYASTSEPLASFDFTYTWQEHASSTPTLRSGTHAPFPGSGSGTASSPYQIASCSDLQALNTSNPSAYYVLTTNIDCTGVSFTPIGLYGNAFTGVLDGQGYTISNVTVNEPQKSTVGVFASVNKATIKNTKFDAIAVSGFYFFGGLTGMFSGSVLDNVHATTSMTNSSGNWEVGGVFGRMYLSTTTSLTLKTTITNTSGQYLYEAGGISPSFSASYIASSTVTAVITSPVASESFGGVVGAVYSNGTIEDVTVTATITNPGNSWYTGGVVGYADSDFYLKNINANVSVYGRTFAGGLVGASFRGTNISKSKVSGTVSAPSGASGVGGLVGYHEEYGNALAVSNSYASTTIIASSSVSRIGGLVGASIVGSNPSTISSSFSSGSITAPSGNKIGGLIGEDDASTITNSFSATTMNISGSTNTGGVAGYQAGANSDNIFNTYFDITRTGQSNCVGATTPVTCIGVNASSSDMGYFYSNTNSPLDTWSTSIWTFLTDDFPFLTIFKPSGPTLSLSSLMVSTSSLIFSWTTDILSSTKLLFGMSTTLTEQTEETNTSSSTRTTSHSTTLTNLLPCTTYYYSFSGTGAYANTASSSVTATTTLGCTGDASVTGQTTGYAGISSTSTVTLTTGGKTITITTPPSYATTSTSIQIKRITKNEVLAITGETPDGLSIVDGELYDLKSVVSSSTLLTSFLTPLVISITYSDDDIRGLEEAGLTIVRYHNSAWERLSGCTVQRDTNTITCTTEHFSLFALAGKEAVAIAQLTSSPSSFSAFGTPSSPTTPTTLPVVTITSTTSPVTITITDTPKFTRVLRKGDTGDDVKLLQSLLNKYSFTVASSSYGSQGNETTYFGTRTERALIKFQEFYANDILTPINKVKGTGIFGILSRMKMEGME
jgi:hypothetical protein